MKAILLLVIVGIIIWVVASFWGSRQFKVKRYKWAVKVYSRIIQAFPSLSMVFLLRGNVYSKLDEPEKALQDYTESINLNSKNKRAYIKRYRLLFYTMKDFDGALRDINHLLIQKPEDPMLLLVRGLVYISKGDYESAIVNSTQGIELMSSNFPAGKNKQLHPFSTQIPSTVGYDTILSHHYYHRGFALGQLNDFDKALEDMLKAHQLRPTHIQSIHYCGYYHYRTNSIEIAMKWYNRVLSLDPQYSYSYGGRGNCSFELGDFQQALEDFQQAAQLFKTDTIPLIRQASIAVAQYALGNTHAAQAVWRSLIEKNKNYNDIEWVAKELGWKGNIVEKARELIASVQDNEPENK